MFRSPREAYTIGRTSSYDRGLANGTETTKLGARGVDSDFPEGYPGGCVWKTAREARDWADTHLHRMDPTRVPSEFSVYLLDLPTGWDTDVSAEPDPDGYYHLLNDAKIVWRVYFPQSGTLTPDLVMATRAHPGIPDRRVFMRERDAKVLGIETEEPNGSVQEA